MLRASSDVTRTMSKFGTTCVAHVACLIGCYTHHEQVWYNMYCNVLLANKASAVTDNKAMLFDSTYINMRIMMAFAHFEESKLRELCVSASLEVAM